MFIETNPFPYLEQGRFAGRGDGEIVFLDPDIPEEEKEWLRSEYKKWWKKRQEEIIESGWE